MRLLTIILVLTTLTTVTRAEEEECPDFECPVKGGGRVSIRYANTK